MGVATDNGRVLVIFEGTRVAGTPLRRFLSDAGFVAASVPVFGAAVAECLARFRPDLVLLEVSDAILDKTIAALHDDMPAHDPVPVMVITEASTPESVRHALEAGARDALTTVHDRTELVVRIRKILDDRAARLELQRENRVLRSEIDREEFETPMDRAERKRLTDQIEAVIGGEHLTVVFQPIFDLVSGRSIGAEALARFSCTPIQSPAAWFSQAGRLGLALQLELAAIRAALAQLASLPADVHLSMNVSPDVARSPAFVTALEGTPLERIVLELTEHHHVTDYRPLVEALAPLRAQGVRLAIDDPGSGVAGLQRILDLRPDIVKLDRTLIDGIHTDPARRALISALVMFTTEIDAILVAEGIETQDELDQLRELGVEVGQGYYLSRPGPLPLLREIDGATATAEPVAEPPTAGTKPFARSHQSVLGDALRADGEAQAAATAHQTLTRLRLGSSPSLELARARAVARANAELPRR